MATTKARSNLRELFALAYRELLEDRGGLPTPLQAAALRGMSAGVADPATLAGVTLAGEARTARILRELVRRGLAVQQGCIT